MSFDSPYFRMQRFPSRRQTILQLWTHPLPGGEDLMSRWFDTINDKRAAGYPLHIAPTRPDNILARITEWGESTPLGPVDMLARSIESAIGAYLFNTRDRIEIRNIFTSEEFSNKAFLDFSAMPGRMGWVDYILEEDVPLSYHWLLELREELRILRWSQLLEY